MKWLIAIVLAFCCTGLEAQLSGAELDQKAVMSIRKRQYDSATVYYQQAAEVYLNNADTAKYYRMRIFSCYPVFRTGRTEESIAELEALAEEVKDMKVDQLPFVAMARLSMLYREDGRFAKATESLKEAFDRFDRSGTVASVRELAGTYTESAKALSNSDFHLESREYFTHAQDLYDSLGVTDLTVAANLYNLFNINLKMGFFYEAGRFLEKSTKMKLDTINDPDHPQMTLNYLALGVLALNQMRLEQAVNYMERSLAISRKSAPNDSYTPNILEYLSQALIEKGDTEAAFKYNREALEFNIAHYTAVHSSVARSYRDLGHRYNETGRYKEAIEQYRKSIEIYSAYGQEYVRFTIPQTQVFLGLNLMIDGAYEEGNVILHQGLSVLRKYEKENQADITHDYRNIADKFYSHFQDYDSALHYYQYALHSRKFGFSSPDIRVNPVIGDYSDYENLFPILLGKARAFTKRYELADDVKDALAALATLEKLDSVAVDFKRSSRVFSDVYSLQAALAEVNALGFELSYKLYEQTGEAAYKEGAFRFSEKNKSNLILSKMSRDSSLVPQPLLDKVTDFAANVSFLESQLFESQRLADTARVAMLEKELFDSRLQEDVYLKGLQASYPAYFQTLYMQQPISLQAVQSQSENEQALVLSYQFQHGRLFSHLISEHGTLMRQVSANDSVRVKIDRYYALLQTPNVKPTESQEFEFLAKHLAELLLPSADSLQQYKKIRISWDNALPSIPFGSLRLNGEYLIKSHEIVYVNSLTINARLSEAPLSKRASVLAFAPVFDTEGLLRALDIDSLRDGVGILKWSSEEVESIKGHFQVSEFIGKSATEQRFRELSPEHSVIHIATHGLQNINQPAYSRLLFSKQDTDSINDGNLYMQEIFQLNIPADMVVLSACHSGAGEYKSGEGLMSLANSFLYAGTKSVVMTLWTANDRSTSRIMQDFYTNLSAGQNKSNALRNAKLTYLEKHKGMLAHPYFWAHFVVNGDDRPLASAGMPSYLWFLLLIPFMIVIIRAAQRKSKK